MKKTSNPKCPICEKEVLLKMGATGSVECPHCHVRFDIGAKEKSLGGLDAVERSMKVERTEDNKLVIPTGYFELEPNEKITKGDLVLTFGSGEWKESRNLGQNILPLSSKVYIRKLDA
jgi:DNA-directed RNA polymerase subunit RPC12/RpoP